MKNPNILADYFNKNYNCLELNQVKNKAKNV